MVHALVELGMVDPTGRRREDVQLDNAAQMICHASHLQNHSQDLPGLCLAREIAEHICKGKIKTARDKALVLSPCWSSDMLTHSDAESKNFDLFATATHDSCVTSDSDASAYRSEEENAGCQEAGCVVDYAGSSEIRRPALAANECKSKDRNPILFGFDFWFDCCDF